METRNINWKKIGLYLLFSFGISWLVAGFLKLCDISLNTASGVAILAVFYMGGPAIATFIIQKFIYKVGFKQYGWNFDKKAIKWLFRVPLLFITFILMTFLVIGLFGNTHLIDEFGRVSFSQEDFTQQLTLLISSRVSIENVAFPPFPPIAPVLLFIIMMIGGTLLGGVVNVPFMFGEEFGWRGLLQKETQPMGFTKSSLFIGTVWGLWHLPVILMGHNYPHYPYLGIAMMCAFTVAVAPLFTYVRIKTRSILGACLLHGMINANATLFFLFVVNGHELFGSIVGIAGILAAILMSTGIYMFDKEFIRNFRDK